MFWRARIQDGVRKAQSALFWFYNQCCGAGVAKSRVIWVETEQQRDMDQARTVLAPKRMCNVVKIITKCYNFVLKKFQSFKTIEINSPNTYVSFCAFEKFGFFHGRVGTGTGARARAKAGAASK
jgi:hypothetical protein